MHVRIVKCTLIWTKNNAQLFVVQRGREMKYSLFLIGILITLASCSIKTQFDAELINGYPTFLSVTATVTRSTDYSYINITNISSDMIATVEYFVNGEKTVSTKILMPYEVINLGIFDREYPVKVEVTNIALYNPWI